MGGYGTYKFSTQFPDLFARAQPTVGPPALGIWDGVTEPTGGESSLTQRMLASVRNIPFLIWDQTTDELVPTPGVRQQVKRFDELNYRYEYDEFHFGEHLTLAINDEFGPAAAFLGNATVQPDPPHVSYTYNPTMDFPADGTTAGHAYWLYGVQLRDSSGTAPIGTIDVRSEGFGVGDPPASATQFGIGVLTPGQIPAIPFTSESKTWGAAPSAPVRDVLDITASNVSHVTIDAKRARVDCHAQLNVTSEGPLTVTLADCDTQPPPPPPPGCGPGNEDNGNGQVADQNGNNGGNFSDDECNGAQNATLADPNHNMSFTASSHGPVAFSSNAVGAPVATTVGEGIANGQPVKYVLVQSGGLLGTQLYSLTLSNASGVIYQRSGSLISGAINVRF
jgi:hypothetical protein